MINGGMPVVGILDIQGSVEEHAAMLKKCGVKVLLVKTRDDLARIDGLIIPGGESTNISMMIERSGLFDSLKMRIKNGMFVYGTCAGAILLAKKIVDRERGLGKGRVKNLGAIDIEIERNAYGGQLDSFETSVKIPALKRRGGKPCDFHAVFIRAPKIKRIGKSVRILAKYGDEIIMVRQKNILISTFHPELGNNLEIHKYFIGAI